MKSHPLMAADPMFRAASPDVVSESTFTGAESSDAAPAAAGRGATGREIARALFVSEATVKTHVNRIFAKTGSRDRGQAVHYAYTRGYASPPG